MSDDRQSLEQMLQDGLPVAPAIGERVLWDDKLRGLGVRLRSGVSPTWIYRRRFEGRLVKRTLAQPEAMSLDQARAAALALGNTETTGRVEVSLNQFAATFMRDCAGRWKPATVDNHRRDLRRLILPTLGDIAIDKLGKADVTIWLDQLDISGRTKDRATSVLSSMMRHAETLGVRQPGSNPCKGRRRHRSTFSARYLAVRDLRRLAVALDQAAEADPVQVACIRFLLLTGARRGEALALEWPMIEGDRAILPDSKTGPKCLWLATPVRRLLAELVRIEGSPLVFARPCGRGLGSSLERVWHGVREGAGLDGLRLHDLRHNYASVAVNIGEELRTVAGLLGHNQMTTTRGYAHLADRPVMAAARRVDEHLAGSLKPPEAVEPIRPKSWGPKKKKKAPELPALMPVYLADLPKPATPKIELSEEEQRWAPHLRAWRKTKLGLPEFCRQEGLDPAAMRKALTKHLKRARQLVEEQNLLASLHCFVSPAPSNTHKTKQR